MYYGLKVSFNIATLVVSLLPKTRITCDKDAFSYQFYGVCAVDLVQSILISYFSYQVKVLLNEKRQEDINRFSEEQK